MGVRDTRMSQSNILALCQEKAPLGCVLKHRQRSRGGRVANDLEFVETLLWAHMMFSPRISVHVRLSAPQVSTHFVTVARRQHLHGNKHNNRNNCPWLSASFPQMLRTCFRGRGLKYLWDGVLMVSSERKPAEPRSMYQGAGAGENAIGDARSFKHKQGAMC